MQAKFHSAPGHSMETTLTINLPAMRGVRGQRDKQKEKDAPLEVQPPPPPPPKLKDVEKEQERARKEEDRLRKEREKEDKEQREREKLERERRALAERGISYKDKFQKMREKYEKVGATHENHKRDLEALNTKLKKLQAENDLLLDAMFLADPGLYDRYFPSGPGSPPLGPAPLLPSHTAPTYGQGHIPYGPPHPLAPPITGSTSSSSASRSIDHITSLPPGVNSRPTHSRGHSSGYRERERERERDQAFYQHQHYPQDHHRRPPSPYGHYPPAMTMGMPPPPGPGAMAPPLLLGSVSSSAERLERGDRDWDRDRHAHDRDRPAPGSVGLPPMPPPLPPMPAGMVANPMAPPTSLASSNGYPSGGANGSLPPPSSARSSRSSSRSRRRALNDVPAPVSSERGQGPMDDDRFADRDMEYTEDESLGGPVHLDVNLASVGRTRRSGSSRGAAAPPTSAYETRGHSRRESMGSASRRSESRTPTMAPAHTSDRTYESGGIVVAEGGSEVPITVNGTSNGDLDEMNVTSTINGRRTPRSRDENADIEAEGEEAVRSQTPTSVSAPASAPVVGTGGADLDIVMSEDEDEDREAPASTASGAAGGMDVDAEDHTSSSGGRE